MMEHGEPLKDFIEEAKRIADAAKERGLALRVMGACAIRIHSPRFIPLHEKLERDLTDLDFVGRKEQKAGIIELFKDLGYSLPRELNYVMTISARYILMDKKNNRAADVFFDKLDFCHLIVLKDRLKIDYPTISLADILLEKMQIVKINEKDIKDTIVLFRAHDVGEIDEETINSKYMSELLSKDWGFYYTVTTNLQKIKQLLPKYDPLTNEDRVDIKAKIDKLLDAIEKKPKSMGWKLRAKVGTKKQWYKTVDEVSP